eukprot:5230323-Alexandrium_andersonii.AAC.1
MNEKCDARNGARPARPGALRKQDARSPTCPLRNSSAGGRAARPTTVHQWGHDSSHPRHATGSRGQGSIGW